MPKKVECLLRPNFAMGIGIEISKTICIIPDNLQLRSIFGLPDNCQCSSNALSGTGLPGNARSCSVRHWVARQLPMFISFARRNSAGQRCTARHMYCVVRHWVAWRCLVKQCQALGCLASVNVYLFYPLLSSPPSLFRCTCLAC